MLGGYYLVPARVVVLGMTDVADRAQVREDDNLAEALARQAERASSHEQPFAIEGKRVCLDCLEPILKKRLKANPQAVRCTECQEIRERRHG